MTKVIVMVINFRDYHAIMPNYMRRYNTNNMLRDDSTNNASNLLFLQCITPYDMKFISFKLDTEVVNQLSHRTKPIGNDSTVNCSPAEEYKRFQLQSVGSNESTWQY